MRLAAADGLPGASLGAACALDGDVALVGADGDDADEGPEAGAAYVFSCEGGTWVQEAKLIPGARQASAFFGRSVALERAEDPPRLLALVGAVGEDTAEGADTGAAHLFVRTGTAWALAGRVTADDGASGDAFGRSVAVDGDLAVVGAYTDDTAEGADAGSAHVYLLGCGAAECPADFNGDGSLNSDDVLAFLRELSHGRADFNGDGATNSNDLFAFLDSFFEGC
jgi:hypothetical protein